MAGSLTYLAFSMMGERISLSRTSVLGYNRHTWCLIWYWQPFARAKSLRRKLTKLFITAPSAQYLRLRRWIHAMLGTKPARSAPATIVASASCNASLRCRIVFNFTDATFASCHASFALLRLSFASFFCLLLFILSGNFNQALGQTLNGEAQTFPSQTPKFDLAQANINVNLRPPQNIGSELQDVQPIDLTPVKLPERANAFDPTETYRTKALYRLPGRLFFSASVENSLRLETNVYQTLYHNRADMIYRVLPNVTIGWALNKKTRVAANYFMFRDQYTRQNSRLSRNIHSVGFRIDRDFPLNEKTNITTGFFARELLFNLQHAANHPLSDLIPSVVITRRYGQHGVLYGSALGQFRFRNVLARYQEIDQFYSIGTVYRKRPWTFLADTTFVVNTGKRKLRGGNDNEIFIITLEAGRAISSRLPVIAFVRAEPIFNIGANSSPGFAGFNFRIFGGLRMEIAKPAIFPIKLRQG